MIALPMLWRENISLRIDKKPYLVDGCVIFLQTELEYTGPLAGGRAVRAVKDAWKRVMGNEQHVVVQAVWNHRGGFLVSVRFSPSRR
jgi:hypothetical protein